MIKVLSRRERVILYITIGVIFFAISFNFFIGPIFSRNAQLNKEISLTKAKLKKRLKLINQKDLLQEKYNKFLANLGSAGLETGGQSNILSELEKLAQASAIHIVDIRPQISEGLSKEKIVDLRTEGTVDGYLKFMYNIEISPLLLNIKRFQLSAKSASQLEGNFSISQLSSQP